MEVRLRRLSGVIRQERVPRIDLLKIDVQRAELDVLHGLDEEHWPLVRQVVLEVHDAPGDESEGRVHEIRALLERHGFAVVIEQDELLTGTDRYNVYAVRPERESAAVPAGARPALSRWLESGDGAEMTGEALRDFARGRLPDYMVPSAVVVIPELPLNRNGKVDRAALPAPEDLQSAEPRQVLGPRNPFEEVLAGIWADLLGRPQVGIDESFFDLGGHSLLATQLVSRVREVFRVELPLRALFEGPTIAELAERVHAAFQAGAGLELPAIQPVARDRDLLLSFAQQRLWFLWQLEPESPAYNSPKALRMRGPLDVAALERTLDEIVRRHEVLRTTFPSADGRPVQRIDPEARPGLPVHDLSADPDREERARAAFRAEAQRPFDLAREIPIRTRLLILGLEDHVLLLTTHHIASDGWSVAVLEREVTALYQAFSAGEPSPLPELPVQYGDFAEWQREWLQGDVLDRQLAYWRGQLAGAPPVLELPLDRPRPPVASARGERLAFALPAALSRSLTDLSRRRSLTPFMTLLAGFQALLSRSSGQPDVSVGTPIAGRHHVATEGLIGFFVNTLVMRGAVEGTRTFEELLGQTRETALQAYAHQDLPFERLVDDLSPERSLMHTPLFQAMLVLQNVERDGVQIGGLKLSPFVAEPGVVKLDLLLSLSEEAGAFRGELQYRTELFDRTTIARLADHLVSLLESAAGAPQTLLSDLALLAPAERHQLLTEWNDTAMTEEGEATLHGLIELQVARSPRAVAVVFEDEALSYAELDRRSGRLAQHLRLLGVGPEVQVGLCAERSLELVVGLLAILKAGGAYVPLDPDYPDSRLVMVLEDARPQVLLAQQALRDRLEGLVDRGTRLLDLEAVEDNTDEAPRIDSGVGPDNAAYVLFTSGSTGRPKGAINTHRAIINRLLWMQRAFGLTAADRVLQKTPFGFDVSVWEFFWPLLTGARLVVAQPGGHQDSAYLLRLVVASGITHLHFVPSMLRAFLEEPGLETCTSVRRVIASGESLPIDLARHFHERLGVPCGTELHNLYGPTEAAVDVTWHTCRLGEERIPIGRPIFQTQIRLLDSAGQLVPTGVAGEVHIGGVQVGRGYLGRPDLTAERFVPDPFGDHGARLYRTGDLARHLPDGEIEYLGRIDHQVKLRGFRIELGEIEAALRVHPAILEAAVLVREDGPGGARLVAYVVFGPEAGEPPSVRELREKLRGDLPEFMLPAAFVPLERMPLTPSGKADRRALARIAPASPALSAGLGGAPAALTPVQEILAGIWSDVLGLDGLPGAEAHFFELGGHSLLATQVISRVRQALGVDVPLRSLFEAPTIAGLAGVIERARRAGAGLAVPPLVPQPRDEAPPLSFAQERLWFVHRLLPESSHYNMPAALRLQGVLDPVLFARTLEEIIHRHEVLRTSFPALGGIPVQRIAPPAPFVLPLVDLSCLPPERRLAAAHSLAAADARRPFDLTRGTALRATLVRMDAQDYAGLFTLHHIVSDGWSRGVFLRDLVAIYGAFREGRPSPLPPLAVQYADFAIWQRNWLRDEALEAQLSYWRSQLDLVPPLEMPLDRPRPSVQRFRAGRVPIHLTPALSESLRRLAGSQGGTLYMVLLAGFAALMHRYTGQDDFALGSPIANRNHAEIEDLIGFFVNSLVLRVRLVGDPVFRDLLDQVREVSLQAYAHQDLPFERLVEELQPERSLSRNPLFQVVLALQNAPTASLELPGLTLSPLGPEGGATRFDLELHVWDLPDGLRGMALYDRDLFDATTIVRVVSHLERQLSEAAAEPGRPLSELELLTGPERRQLLAEWNDTAVGFGPFAGVRQRFETWVRETPDALAVAMRGEELTYRELDLRANRLAHHLRALGAGPEKVVGLCLERSVDLIVAILAAVKTGGAYLPLDTAYPAQRLEFMLRDAGALAVVVHERLAPAVAGAGAHVVRIDDDSEAIAARGSAAPETVCLPQGLAYVIYTSGSTGRPKGVALTHAGLANLVSWHLRSYGVAPQDRATQLAGSAFDASVWEVWPYLTAGASLHLPDEVVRASAPDLLRWLAAEKVTHSFLPTPLAEACLRQTTPPGLALSVVLTGGDRLHRLLEEPPYRLVNHYGPTESTVVASCAPVAAVDDQDPPIGRPIDNLRIYVADRHLRPVPIGVPGELLIAGVGLARGYLGQPVLTAQRFVPDPFGGSGGRLYRTGDLTRWRRDGQLEFLSRIDHQVKLRGFRIELGEIESLLLEHPEVGAGAVLTREDVPGQQRLVAYVAPARMPAEEPAGDVGEEQVEEWRALYDETYEKGRSTEDATFNIVGWDSSYTREPIPAEEMREWVERTVEEILALGPQRVIEIGIGTGLLLYRVAPGCELYLGTDFSHQAITGLAERLGGSLPQVELAQRTAEDFSGIAPRSFDTVILNSVVQYFPDADYLARVLAGAVEAVADGGAVYVGDVRSLPLLEAFYASVELFQATPSLSLERLRQLAAAQRAAETELVIDPGFFFALQSRLERIAAVEVRPKRGLADNELTRFRYQVVLRVGRETAAASELPWRDWEREGFSLEAVRRRLAEGPEALALSGVPNVRVEQALAAARALAEIGESEGPKTAGELRERLRQLVPAGVHPDDLLAAARETGYEAVLSWAQPGPEGRFDVLFHRPGGAGRLGVEMPHPAVDGPWSRSANNPTLGKLSRRLAPALRSYLEERLPAHMVPSAFVLLDELPLTPNGKVDRRALPAPEAVRLQEGPSTPARTPVEGTLAAIFCEVLHLDRLGVEDDFFAAGGHSLLATQVISRIREAFEIELPLRSLFETPTVAGLALLVEAVQAEQGASAAPPLRPVPRDGALPLSFSQERLWFLHRLDTRKLAYNEGSAFRLEGRLDAAALRWSLTEILRRHESLRTTFPEVDGWAVQRIQPPAPFELPTIDLSGLPPAVRDGEARRLVHAQALHPFDLTRGPLVRGLLLRQREREHAVLFFFHHIVFDGWSTALFIRELSALYGARVAGAPSPLPPLAIQYADFAAWQRQWLQGEVLEGLLAYWRERLTGAAVLALPTDRPRSVLTQAPGGQSSVVIPPALTEKLRVLSRSRGTTLFMTLLAVFQTLLHRYTGQKDLVVGSPIANRNRSELENLIGFFVNMLVLRTDLSGDPSFLELLDRVRQVALGAYAHQDLPFEKLVEELRPDRDLRHTPLFQVGFRLLNVPASHLKLPGLSLAPFPFDARAAKFDLDLGLIEEAERLNGRLEYDAALFDGVTMDRLVGHLDRLLAGIVEDPGSRLSELPLLAHAERHQLLAEWNDRDLEGEGETTLHALIEAQVERTPEAVAAVFGELSLSYAELDRRAGRLARRLRRLGVGPEVRVGICAERSLELVIGLLGILKAGGAWVPLDPSYPDTRLALVVEDARPPVVLTQEALRQRLDGLLPREVRGLDIEVASAGAEETPRIDSGAGPDNAAYVLFTSGSTGRPKGAINTHRGIVNRLLWMQSAYGLTAEDRVLQKTPFGFDVSVWEFFWPLLTGARLVVARPGEHQDSSCLVRTIVGSGVTHLHFVPSMLRAFLEEPAVESCMSLRRVIASGEELPLDLARRFHERLGAHGVELHNLYGPTEAAVDVTFHACRPGDERVPIGRPVARTPILLLDADGQLVPAGVAGELLIGGVQVGRGYLERPDLTAERFVPNPFGEPGGRLYRTGDLARWLPEGEVEYLGRIDHQVKIRGVRIEPGEIEVALRRLPGVREAVVVAREDRPGEPRLVAYVAGDIPQDTDLRELLRDSLPSSMVPSRVVRLDALPLTPNGKIDRRALPVPAAGPSAPEVCGALLTPAEEMLAGAWADLLGLERIGADESFFALGGHSLLATRAMARVRAVFGVDLPVRVLFETPTVRAVAAAIEAEQRAGAGLAVPPLGRSPRPEILPLTFAQQRLRFLYQLDPENPFYNNLTVLALEGRLDVEALRRAVGEVVRRHEVLRTVYPVVAGRPVQRIEPWEPVSVPVVDLSALAAPERERERQRHAADEALRPFDLESAPVLRPVLLRLAAEENALLFSLHHIASDAWSSAILVREITTLYDAFRQGRPSPLPELPVQYADFAAWQQRWLQGAVLEQHLAYWRKVLGGNPPALALPTDRPRSERPGRCGRRRTFRVPQALSRSLVDLSRREGVTLFMTLLAALDVLLQRLTGQDDVVVSTAVAHRSRAETENLIGLFVEMLPLRVDLSGNPCFLDLLRQVREVCLGAFAHQDFPLEGLIEELRRDGDAASLFRVAFGVRNSPVEELRVPGLILRPVARDEEAVRFDLTIWATETPGGLETTWTFRTDLFEESTIERMNGRLEALLWSLVAAPEACIHRLDRSDEESQRRAREDQAWRDGEAGRLLSIRRRRAVEAGNPLSVAG
ncbi:MAG TPA: amino acid adenylation domain-containing protein [Thermoanaerobaculia bacterium]|nr:amino acid adenylation domain-containing protein [Thermoanaerobaculia bacterium]